LGGILNVMPTKLRQITIAHSPDLDDAFMFYALACGKIDVAGLAIKQVTNDIQSLNLEALEAKYDVSAISFAAYPLIRDCYFLATCGASMGESYGPVLIATKPLSLKSVRSATVAIPGRLTTAFLCLQLYQPKVKVVELPFDQIIEAVANNKVDAGLLIHEGQLTYRQSGFRKILDLGEWWNEETGLPLPLGGNAIRKNLGHRLISQLARIIKESIIYSLANRVEALAYASAFGKGMSTDLADKYIDMYVNPLTIDLGDRGKKAIELLFQEAFAKGILPELIVPEFAG